MMGEELLTWAEISEELALDYRSLDHWHRRGAITASRAANRPGSRRGYSPAEVERLATIARIRSDLRELGIDQLSTTAVRRLWDGLAAGAAEVQCGAVTIRLGA